jgi:hypothetical protein
MENERRVPTLANLLSRIARRVLTRRCVGIFLSPSYIAIRDAGCVGLAQEEA